VGLLSRLDRFAGRLTRRLTGTAAAASVESGAYHGDAGVNAMAVQVGMGEIEDATARESNVEEDERDR
jgi:hypothetical protein